MVSVLIPTINGDLHAQAVACALRNKGHKCDLLFCKDVPAVRNYSLELNNEEVAWSSSSEIGALINDDAEVVWNRRPSMPCLPEHWVHPEDLIHAQRELKLMHESVFLTMCAKARWVNPQASAVIAASKALQLQHAAAAGFRIPNTLISNDPKKIHQFMCKNNRVVYKTFQPMSWQYQKGHRAVFARIVYPKDMPSDRALQCTPGIYQEFIESSCELRITIFGNHCITLQIQGSPSDTSRVDSRERIRHDNTKLISLPGDLYNKCISLMERFGLVFSTFDIIIDKSGKSFFLELNEAGNFLFIERMHPESLMLNRFSEFLIDPNSVFDVDKLEKICKLDHINEIVATAKF